MPYQEKAQGQSQDTLETLYVLEELGRWIGRGRSRHYCLGDCPHDLDKKQKMLYQLIIR